jgi:hypothetical protein
MTAKRHANMGSMDLGVLVNAAKEVRDKDEEDKARDRAAGRRNEIDDLPAGHPLRVMMEDAKRRHEAGELLKKKGSERAEAEAKLEVKTAKKLGPRVPAKEAAPARDEEHRRRARVSNDYNAQAQAMLQRMEEFRGAMGAASKSFHGFPGVRVKLERANRALVAACYAINESKIDASERG